MRPEVAGLVLVLTSCGKQIKVETPAPPEFTSGVSYTNYLVPEVPWSIHVIRVSRASRDLEFYSLHAKGTAVGVSTLSAQIQSLSPELGVPVAAVNGDFFIREKKPYTGDPRGIQVREGELLSAPIGGVGFWFDADGLPQATNVVSLFKVIWPSGVATAFGLNEERRNGPGIVLYTPSMGAAHSMSNGLDLVLEPAGSGPWLPLRLGTAYTARVREVRAAPTTLRQSNTMVLSIARSLRGNFPGLQPGAVLRLYTDTSPDLRGVQTAISGGPMLVRDGQRQKLRRPDGHGPLAYQISSMWERHPRTALGWNESYFFLVEVDGRQKKLSVGMTLNELANFLIGMGCQQAVNFDGGGSTMMWCNGRIMNSPSDGRERDIANALLVMRKPAAKAAVEESDAARAAGPKPE